MATPQTVLFVHRCRGGSPSSGSVWGRRGGLWDQGAGAPAPLPYPPHHPPPLFSFSNEHQPGSPATGKHCHPSTPHHIPPAAPPPPPVPPVGAAESDRAGAAVRLSNSGLTLTTEFPSGASGGEWGIVAGRGSPKWLDSAPPPLLKRSLYPLPAAPGVTARSCLRLFDVFILNAFCWLDGGGWISQSSRVCMNTAKGQVYIALLNGPRVRPVTGTRPSALPSVYSQSIVAPESACGKPSWQPPFPELGRELRGLSCNVLRASRSSAPVPVSPAPS